MTEPAAQVLDRPRTLGYIFCILESLNAVAVYETFLVGLDTYGYSLSRGSSDLVFFNGFLLMALVLALYRISLRAIPRMRIPRPEGWMSLCLSAGLIAFYGSWCFDRWLRLGLMEGGQAGFSVSPPALADYVLRFFEEGLWGWGNAWFYDAEAVQGNALIVWWLLEASMMLLAQPGRLPEGLGPRRREGAGGIRSQSPPAMTA